MDETAEEENSGYPGPVEELIFRAPELCQRATTDRGCGAPPADFLLLSWRILKGVLTNNTAEDQKER
jgi:hypothetical protein